MGMIEKLSLDYFQNRDKKNGKKQALSKQKLVKTTYNRGFSSRNSKNTFEEKASSIAPMVAYQSVGKPVWTPRSFEALSKQGYQKNVIVYRCVNLIARSLSSIPWKLYDGEQEVLEHPLLTLLNQPSEHVSGGQLKEDIASYLLLSGNSYVECVGNSNGDGYRVNELHSLRPDRIRVIPHKSGVVGGYEYAVDGQKKIIPAEVSNSQNKGRNVTTRPIMHIKLFNPLNDWYGMSPIEAAACSIDQHNTVASHNLSILQNGGRPSGALMVDTKNRGYDYSREELDELRDDLRRVAEGHDNAGRIMMLQGDFQWQEMGLSPKDMDFIEGKLLSAREIAQAFNVPSMLVGVPGDSTFSNYKEARYHLWEDTILPLMDLITESFNGWIVANGEDNLRLSYDVDRIPALAAKREDTWAKLAKADFLTVNEKRRALGYGPVENGDKLMRESHH